MKDTSERDVAAAMPETAYAAPDWRDRLSENWPDALRLFAAALLAYVAARLIGLHETHWAVLTTLITTRGHAGGTARAGTERLVATVAGAALAVGAAWARHALQVDSGIVLFTVLAPLCLLVAAHPNYRGAPVAALIVLSSGTAAGMDALGTAMLRTGEIALGAVSAIAVSAIVFPSRARVKARLQAATILRLLAEWLRLIFARESEDDERLDALRAKVRAELRELTVLVHSSGWRKMQDKELVRLLKSVSAFYADVAFLGRAMARKPLAEVVVGLQAPLWDAADALIAAVRQSAASLIENAAPPDRNAIDVALKNVGLAARESAERIEPRHAQALIYLLRMASVDLNILSAVGSAAPIVDTGSPVALADPAVSG